MRVLIINKFLCLTGKYAGENRAGTGRDRVDGS